MERLPVANEEKTEVDSEGVRVGFIGRIPLERRNFCIQFLCNVYTFYFGILLSFVLY